MGMPDEFQLRSSRPISIARGKFLHRAKVGECVPSQTGDALLYVPKSPELSSKLVIKTPLEGNEGAHADTEWFGVAIVEIFAVPECLCGSHSKHHRRVIQTYS
nr:hypothetical protein HmN_000882600 [Hymenolepis microstoma]